MAVPFTQKGSMEKQQGGEENEFTFGYTELEGSLAPLRGVGSYGDEYGDLGSGWRLGLRCPENTAEWAGRQKVEPQAEEETGEEAEKEPKMYEEEKELSQR